MRKVFSTLCTLQRARFVNQDSGLLLILACTCSVGINQQDLRCSGYCEIGELAFEWYKPCRGVSLGVHIMRT